MTARPRAARTGVLVLVALAMSAPTLAAGTWLQAGGDAGRTGATDLPGPEFDDESWTVRLPGLLPAGVLLEGRVAYVLVTPRERFVDNGPPFTDRRAVYEGESGIFRIDLDRPEPVKIVALEPSPIGDVTGSASAVDLVDRFVADADRFYTLDNRRIDAWDRTDGSLAWSVDLPRYTAYPYEGDCVEPAVSQGVLYVFCDRYGATLLGAVDVAAAYDAASGRLLWTWVKETSAEAVRGLLPSSCSVDGAPCVGHSLPRSYYLSVVEPYVFATTYTAGGARSGLETATWALDAEAGTLLWAHNSTPGAGPRGTVDVTRCRIDEPRSLFCNPFARVVPPRPTGSPNVVYLRLDQFMRALNPATGELIWQEDLGREDAQIGGTSASVFAGGVLYATSYQTIYRFNTPEGGVGWPFTLDPTVSEHWLTNGLAFAGGRLYALATTAEGADVLYAFDAANAAILWRKPLAPAKDPEESAVTYAVGDGVVALARVDGNLTLLGRSAVSPRVQAAASSGFPAIGEEVTVDLSGSGPGLSGAVTSFRAVWGDGSETDWQAEPILRHAYASPGEYRARVQAATAANESASEVLLVHVGATKPTFLENAFKAENQNATFFVLGIAGTAIGGVVGLARLQRRRGALEHELRILEHEYERTRARPLECERALAERKSRARTLLIERKLDESQCHLLERRIDDLTRTLRLHELSDLLDLLPRGMAHALEEVLADGRVTTWERRSFLEVLEHDRVMPPEMKVRVRALIDEWYARDNTATARTLIPGGPPEPAAADEPPRQGT